MNNFRNSALCLIFASFCILLGACKESRLGSGVVATVNGEPITLLSLQTLMDSRLGAMGVAPGPSAADMKINYGRALGTLVAHALVRQDLSQRGIEISQIELDQTIRDIDEDLGMDTLDAYMKDSYIRKDEWLELMRDYLALEIFREQVLLPAIKIEKDEVRDYYRHHAREFTLPESLSLCLLTAESRNALEEWSLSFKNREIPPDSVAQCVDVSPEEVPLEWQKEVKNLAPYSCGKPRSENDEWQTVCLVSRMDKRALPLPDVYALIEKNLLAQKQNTAFDEWLEQKLKTAEIKVVPELNECLAIGHIQEAAGDAFRGLPVSGNIPARD